MNTIVNYRQVPVTEVLVIVDWKLLNACSVKMTCLDIRETLMQGVFHFTFPPTFGKSFFLNPFYDWFYVQFLPNPGGRGVKM